jgi:hypothetical protein
MKVIHYINLVITILHSSLLLTSGILSALDNEELFIYAGYSHIAFGVFQVVLSLICLFFINKMEIDSKNYLFKYYVIVVVYFVIMYVFSTFDFSNEFFVLVSYFLIIPMIVAYYFVFTTRNIMRNLKRN